MHAKVYYRQQQNRRHNRLTKIGVNSLIVESARARDRYEEAHRQWQAEHGGQALEPKISGPAFR
jgi:hypothetical protein